MCFTSIYIAVFISDKPHGAQMFATGDDVDYDKKNGRKQRTLFQAFGDVFKSVSN